MSVNEKMTAIADAIRGKTGETSPLSLDAMATAIAGISGLSFTNGTFDGATTWSSTSATYNSVTVTHGLGKTPSFIMIFLDDTVYTPSYNSSISATYTQLIYSFANIYTNETADALYIAIEGAYVSHSRFTYYSSGSTTTKYTAKASVTQNGNTAPLANASSLSSTYGIKNITESTFDAPTYAYNGKTYKWYAFG